MSKLFQMARRTALESDIPEEGKDPSNKDADQPTDAFIEENKQKAEKPEEPSEKDEQVPAPTEEDHEVTEEATSDEAMEQDQARIQEEAEEVKEIGSLTVTLERLQEQLAGPQTAFSQSIIQQTIGELQTRLGTKRRSIGVENYDTTYARDDVADLKNALDAREQNLTKAVAKEGFLDKVKAFFGDEMSMLKVSIEKCTKALESIQLDKEYVIDVEKLKEVFSYKNGIKPESILIGFKTIFKLIEDIDAVASGFTSGAIKPSSTEEQLVSFLEKFNSFKYVLEYGKGVSAGLTDSLGCESIDLMFPFVKRNNGSFWATTISFGKNKPFYKENASVTIKGSNLKDTLEYIVQESKKAIALIQKALSESERLDKKFSNEVLGQSPETMHLLTTMKIYKANFYFFQVLSSTIKRLTSQIKYRHERTSQTLKNHSMEGFFDKVKADFGDLPTIMKTSIANLEQYKSKLSDGVLYKINAEPMRDVFSYQSGDNPLSIVKGVELLFQSIKERSIIAHAFTNGTIKPDSKASSVASFFKKQKTIREVYQVGTNSFNISTTLDLGWRDYDIIIEQNEVNGSVGWAIMNDKPIPGKVNSVYTKDKTVTVTGEELKEIYDLALNLAKDSIPAIKALNDAYMDCEDSINRAHPDFTGETINQITSQRLLIWTLSTYKYFNGVAKALTALR